MLIIRELLSVERGVTWRAGEEGGAGLELGFLLINTMYQSLGWYVK